VCRDRTVGYCDFRELAAQGGRGGIHAIETSVAHIASLISSATAVSVALITGGLLNPWLPAVLLLPVLVDGWTAARIARLNYQNFLDIVTHNMRKAVIEEAVTARGFALERHALTLQERLLAEYREVSEQLTCEKAVLARRSALTRTTGRLAAGMATLLAYAALASLLYLRVMPLALAGTTVVAMQTASMALTAGMRELNALYENSFRMDFYRELITSAAKRKARVTGHSAPRQPKTISLDRVGFTYPGQRQPALVDINLVVRRGETIALVGENGSGKSTLAKLITGLYEPTSGSIYWDAIDLATVDEQSIHQQIAVIAQDPTRWPTTAVNSVLLGTHEVEDPVDRWRKATSSTGVDRIIATLPHGGNTLLSKRFRNGHELSGGQWQRFGVARGIHRRAHILVADEPTSALDADAEARVFTALHETAQDHQAITILVTHRLANLASATRIVVLDHGRIAESGTHEELLALGGQYRRLFDIQARAYRTILDRPESTNGLV
jgi:ATP-binding cassette, subfamily B, bacterial